MANLQITIDDGPDPAERFEFVAEERGQVNFSGTGQFLECPKFELQSDSPQLAGPNGERSTVKGERLGLRPRKLLNSDF
jgi:hypothetical protein